MSCGELQDQFVCYLLDELSPAEVHMVEAHLASNCASCQAELAAIREALELVFAAAPETDVNLEQRQRIARQALCKSSPEISIQSTEPVPPQGWVAGPGKSLTAKLFQALLAIAAGFFLMVGWQTVTSSQRPAALSQQNSGPQEITATQATTQLSGVTDLPRGSSEHVHYVSIKMRPTQANVQGYYLYDAFSGQLHIVGNIERAPRIGEQFRLIVVTDTGETELPVIVNESGRFLKILPTTESTIREIFLQASTASN